jgi:hypothetical protein
MHTHEAAQEPIFDAVAHEAAGPAIAHDENANPVLYRNFGSSIRMRLGGVEDGGR